MSYVDGFVPPVPKKRLDDYRRIARKAGKIPRLEMDPAARPVDIKRMVYGGFDVLVNV